MVAPLLLAGCAIMESYQREHHLNDLESTALILSAKDRVVTQRRVNSDDQYVGRIAPGVVSCAEPSPDVANALSTALTASLSGSLPSARGANDVALDFSRSSAESIMQLGTRIATIQLLRDELADLCRSYANGAVSSTTYTLRLSRLDKKMVTLLLSESAGRPAGSQLLILGSASTGNVARATEEQLQEARQRVSDTSKKLSDKETELKDAAEDAKITKTKERDDARKEWQAAIQALVVAERGLLTTQGGAQWQSVAYNAPGDGSRPGSDLVTIQDNFLLQDDLSTFLDACISSLDLLQKKFPDEEEQAELSNLNERARQAATDLAAAEVAMMQAKEALERAREEGTADQRAMAILQEEMNERDRRYMLLLRAAQAERETFDAAASKHRPLSRFGEYCRDRALDELIRANADRVDVRLEMMDLRRLQLEAETRMVAMQSCSSVLRADSGASEGARKACSEGIASALGGTRVRDSDPRGAPGD
jgi:hypothetical protein